LGGRGLNTKLLFEPSKVVDPLDVENMIIFSLGKLVGRVPTAGQLTITSKVGH
jgi:aldehyde:ferredoxin oxidoreductase